MGGKQTLAFAVTKHHRFSTAMMRVIAAKSVGGPEILVSLSTSQTKRVLSAGCRVDDQSPRPDRLDEE